MKVTEVTTFAVAGAGQMGRGIAQVAAEAGFKVLLSDVSLEVAKGGRERIAKDLERLVSKGRLEAARRDLVMGLIEPSELEAASAAQVLVEAATERLEAKLELFRRFDAILPQGALLASNTSSLSITRLAAVTKRPSDVIGMHFMNPVPVMRLVEIVRGLQTSEATLELTLALADKLGKTTIVSNDRPGFIVNRVLVPLINEACFALEEGVGKTRDIDTGVQLGLNHPMGPLELADLVGLDTVLSILEIFHREFGDGKYRPAPILRNFVAAGWLGRKTGRGFYTYDENGKKSAPTLG
jgi:3-hydroxybutyryl-CoA dehydrogenase